MSFLFISLEKKAYLCMMKNDCFAMSKFLVSFLMCVFPVTDGLAQMQEIKSKSVASLQVVAGNDWLKAPAIPLGGNKRVNISFDELSHDARRYTYTVTHCEPDWSDSDGLIASDYVSGFQRGLTIDDYNTSLNTNQLYTHYRLSIPNADCRILMSGNYRVDIIDEENDEIVASARFMVYESVVGVSKEVKDNTDIDFQRSHQQIDLKIQYPASINCISPREQFRVAVMQNSRLDNMVWCPPAPQLTSNSLLWTHSPKMIFSAGNEYHAFEILDVDLNSMGVESIDWDGENYHVHLYHDYPRRAYVYNEDANGAFLLRNSDNYESETTSEYVKTHFYFDSPQLPGKLYLNGNWANSTDRDAYLMTYDEEKQCYSAVITMKYGYYSYQYLLYRDEENSDVSDRKQPVSRTFLTEGDFFQTENEYLVLVYYKASADRTWRLVGVGW